MKKKWMWVIPVIAVLFVTIGGQVVMQLWNWLMPAIFGWKEITFWQAIGLLALCRILFGGGGGWRGRRRHRHHRSRIAAGRWCSSSQPSSSQVPA